MRLLSSLPLISDSQKYIKDEKPPFSFLNNNPYSLRKDRNDVNLTVNMRKMLL